MLKKYLAYAAIAMSLAGTLMGCSKGASTNKETNSSAAETTTVAKDAGSSTDKLEIVTTSQDYVRLFDKFTKDTNIQTEMLSMSSGEVLSKVKAENGTPMADLWFGGGIDAFMSAKEEGLLAQVKLDAADSLALEYKDPDGYWYTKGLTIVGFIVNNNVLKEKNLTAPASWADLIKPEYKGQILMSNPAISGTNYGVVNAMLQVKGEDEGWKYLTALNENIDFYSKRGGDPREKTAAGEVAIGITPMDNKTAKLAEEQNCSLVYPSDGIPYVPEGVAVFKGAAHQKEAEKFLNWLYSDDENLKLLAEIDGKDTIKVVKPSIEGLNLTFDTNTLLKEDLSLFGKNRDAILAKWDTLAGAKSEK